MTHTPGPWQIDYGKKYPRGVSRVNRTDALGGINSIVRWNGIGMPSSVEGHANARLIAAAPELLAALKAVVAIADRRTDEFDAARAAIAKATGVS